ncbi:MAG: radical SAM family heme chaperone HemW [Lachnospiraceae bacterium]|nr:radical SAM family heme chaperone HemW [Lachnospiraceae bacterium]
MKNEPLALYVHIPFCVRKCLYCDFLSFPASEEVRKAYLKALGEELEREAPAYADRRVSSIFFGGGTPSTLAAEEIEEIMAVIRRLYLISEDAEITLEANPGTLTPEKLRSFGQAGIRRLSMGAQSFDDDELKTLGRIHRAADIRESFRAAREAGFDNINLDLICGLPGQRVEDWEYTLREALSLAPEHISAYSLIVEEGTPFHECYHEADERRGRGEEQELLPGEEEEREMIKRCRELLGAAGYVQYEISNYALPGRECRHNLVYWERGDYAGFGLGAASCVDERRWKNTEELKEYFAGGELRRELQLLDPGERQSEAMFLGLRLMRGVDCRQFAARYGVDPHVLYGEEIERMLSEGLLEEEGAFLRLSLKGQDLANRVMAAFV